MDLSDTKSQSTGTGDLDILSDPESFFANTYYDLDDRLENINFSSKNTVEKLKMIYDGIDFYDGFWEGDLSVYDYYAEKYSQLLKGEVRYYDPKDETYNDIYFYTPEYLIVNPDSAHCFLYDMDEDSKPELCLTGVRGGICL